MVKHVKTWILFFKKGHLNTEAPALRGRQAKAHIVAVMTSRLAPDFLFTKGHWTCSLGLFKRVDL